MIEQRSAEWHKQRLGLPTCSQFHRIVTAQGKASRSKLGYMCQLLAERIFGVPFGPNIGHLKAVRDGIEREDPAREALSAFLRVEVRKAEFTYFQDHRFGGSPDGWVGDDPVEIKCPTIPGIIEDMLETPEDHWVQLQGHCLVTGRDQVHFWSWNPFTPSSYDLIPRGDAFCNTLHYHLTKFCNELEQNEAVVRAKGLFDVEGFLASLEGK